MWDELPEDVHDELTDERFTGRKHYKRATYAKGCHGPLCRKAEKDRGRERNEQRAREAGRTYRPALAYRRTDREAELDIIIAWHLAEIKEDS